MVIISHHTSVCIHVYIYNIHGDARLYMQYVRKQVTILPSANASDTSTRLWHHVGPPSSWHSQWCRCTLGCSSWGQVVHLTAFGLSREPPNSLGRLHQFRDCNIITSIDVNKSYHTKDAILHILSFSLYHVRVRSLVGFAQANQSPSPWDCNL